MKRETVSLCLPVYENVHPKAWLAHQRISHRLGQLDVDVGMFYCRGITQPHAQNYLFNDVLENRISGPGVGGALPVNNTDWILWVESDACPPYNAFELLREHADPETRPVVHGLSFDRKPPYHPSMWKNDEKGRISPIMDWKPNTLYQLAHSGTCIVLIHTSVFRKMKRPWFRMQPFEPGVQGMIPCLSLSNRMHEAKIPIWGFTGCIATHIGEEVEVGPELSRAYKR